MRATNPTGVATDDRGPGIATESAVWHGGWLRVAIALVLAGQGMAFGLAANQTPPESLVAFRVLHGGLAASALIVLVLLGGPLLRESWASLRAGRITVDLLFLISLSGAFGVSVASTLRRDGPVFYELVAILLAIYTVGKLLGARSRVRALRAVEALREEHAVCTRVDAAGRRERVPVDQMRSGDRVIVGAGETVAVDGVIARGRSLVWTTPLTGEPDPAVRGPGDPVLAGMRAVDGVLEVTVTAAAGARRLDMMLRAVEEARLAPSALQRAADRLAARFVPLVLVVCAGTFAFWLERGTLVQAVENGLAVLVVACPCALGLATPLGIWSALVRLARLGIVARSGDFVEALATADTGLFDKTGTLCEPDLRVGAFRIMADSPLPPDELRAAIAAAEAGIEHPVAAALRGVTQPAEGSRGVGDGTWTQLEARVIPAGGVRARVRATGHGREVEVIAGTPSFLADSAVDVAGIQSQGGTDDGFGLRRVWVAVDRVLAAQVELREQPRASAGDAFAGLRDLGWSVEILTGDRMLATGGWPGVQVHTGMTPDEKAARVRLLQARGARVLFVGDGLNDAPALSAADVAIAIREGADLARSTALAVVSGQNLGTLPAAVRVARAVRAAIRSNLHFAVGYNTVAMALAAVGWVHPVLAALLMAGSSAIVSTRVLRAGGEEAPPLPATATGTTG